MLRLFKCNTTFEFCLFESESSLRGRLASLSVMSFNLGILIVMGFGAILSWRQVSFICGLFPICCFCCIYFVPESPHWLLSKDRPNDAEKSLQWLRGWVSPSAIHNEFTELQAFSRVANACTDCSKRSVKCIHPTPSFWTKIKEIRRKRNAKPFALCFGLYFLYQFSLVTVWQPYIIQVLKALGTPLDANLVTLVNASFGTIGSILLMMFIQKIGRRKIYLTSIMIVTLCSFGLGRIL